MRRGARRATRSTRTRRSWEVRRRPGTAGTELQHAALRLTARGWETAPLPAPDGSGALVVALDLRTHEALVEHSGGRASHRARPDRAVGEVTREVLAAARALAGPVEIDPTPQEVTWSVPLDRGRRARHIRPRPGRRLLRGGDPGGAPARRVPRAVPRAVDAGQRVVGVVRPRRQPLLGSAGRPAVGRLHHAQRDGRAGGRRRLVARRRPLRQGGVLRLRASGAGQLLRDHAVAAGRALGVLAGRVHPRLGRRALTSDPAATALEFARSAFQHACVVCEWDPALPASAAGPPPPVV